MPHDCKSVIEPPTPLNSHGPSRGGAPRTARPRSYWVGSRTVSKFDKEGLEIGARNWRRRAGVRGGLS